MPTNKVYQIVTDRILAELAAGVIPWKKTWSADGSLPMNLISKKEYRGTNLLLLPSNYSSPFFLTYNQCKKLGGFVRKGENSYPVIFWKFFDKTDSVSGEKTGGRIPMLRYYRVFNVEQCENIDPKKIPVLVTDDMNEIEPLEYAEDIINAMPKKPEIKHNESKAYYSPRLDYVNMPKKNLWAESTENYYAVLFHELTHSTGHVRRCNRGIETNAGFGSVSYSKEELIAEMGSAFLCSITGILTDDVLKQSAAYIESWTNAIRNDNKLVVTASGKAQKAVDYILGKQDTQYINKTDSKPVEAVKTAEVQVSLF